MCNGPSVDRARESTKRTGDPIAHSLLKMDKGFHKRICQKFDICYLIYKQNLAFTKYPETQIWKLGKESILVYHISPRIQLLTSTHFIAESQSQQFIESMSSRHFYSFLTDGSTDVGNVDNEVIAVVYCKRDDKAAEIKSYGRYVSVPAPHRMIEWTTMA